MIYNLNHKILSQAETHALIRAAQQGCDAALERLVTHNFKLCRTVIQKTFPDFTDTEADALMGDAVIGLMKAIREFDVENYQYLSSYAYPAIQHTLYISDIVQPHLIYLPNHIMEKRRVIHACIRQLEQMGIVEPTFAQIHEQIKQVDKDFEHGYDTLKISVESLDAPVSDENAQTRQNFIGFDEGFTNEVHAGVDVQWFLSHLNDWDRHLVERYYGIGCSAMSLRQIANALPDGSERGRSVEGLRQNIKMILTFLKRLARLTENGTLEEIETTIQSWQTYRNRSNGRQRGNQPKWLQASYTERLKPEYNVMIRLPREKLMARARRIRELHAQGVKQVTIAEMTETNATYVNSIIHGQILVDPG